MPWKKTTLQVMNLIIEFHINGVIRSVIELNDIFLWFFSAGFSPFVLRDVDSKSALLRAKNGGNIKQWARNHAYRNMKKNSKK